MLLIACPFCGPRAEIEFTYNGEAHLVRDPSSASDQEWTAFLYQRSNSRGVQAERWRHAHGCGRFFNALRNTGTDQFLAIYRIGEARPAMDSSR
jgi:sarcosine oxidase subunit delta